MDNMNLGDYRLIKQVGQGALGTVYLAEHRFMKRHYMLKILPEEFSSDRGFLQRFQEEISALSVLEHPNIVRMHNVSHGNGKTFLVTDCVVDDMGETTNLAQYLATQSGLLPKKEVQQILLQIADALDYAHNTRQLAHGGLKLNNVLVSRSPTGIKVALSDFGLSRIIGTGSFLTRTYRMIAEAYGILEGVTTDTFPTSAVESSRLTPLHHSFLQSFAFLAPEQKHLAAPHTNLRSDTYAFGVLAYFLLTGTAPEGLFPMPDDMQWQTVLKATLASNPEKRATTLKPLVEAVSNAPSPSIPVEPPPIAIPQPTKVLEPAMAMAAPTAELKPRLAGAQLERPVYDPDPAQSLQPDASVISYHPEERPIQDFEPIKTDMVVVTGGEFYRGSNTGSRDEVPAHMINLPSFAVDIHSVTNEQYVRFLEVLGAEKDHMNHDMIRLRESRIKRAAGKLSIESGYAKHPVVGVTWYGAVVYAKWVGKRLPTEAEWEVVARGVNNDAEFPTGSDIEKKDANYFSSDSTPVMSYAPNSHGVYDLAGNVYEWCHDWYGYNTYETSAQEPDNPKGPVQGVYRVLRGGCWKSLNDDLRCSHRHRNNPGTFNSTYGFRCAADAD